MQAHVWSMQDPNDANCRYPPDVVAPEVDPHRCEGKEKCANVCPYGVFEIRKLTRDERAGLPFFVRLKVAAHGGKQAFPTLAGECHGCGSCVEACPEDAIRLVRVSG